MTHTPFVRRCHRAASFLIGLFCAASALAQSATTATLTGRVQNRDAGLYLNNARVSVEGTELQAFTNEAGEYRLAGVPAGQVRLRAFYTGLQAQIATVSAAAGGTVQQDFQLTKTGASGSPDAVVLDTFVVSNARETNADAIAINEQRFAANLKNVVSTESFGPIVQNNIGEFLKYLPGVDLDYVESEARGPRLGGMEGQYVGVSDST
jgi:hypothetical protein